MNKETVEMVAKAKDRNDIIKAYEELRGEKVVMNPWWENATLGQLIDGFDAEVSVKKLSK